MSRHKLYRGVLQASAMNPAPTLKSASCQLVAAQVLLLVCSWSLLQCMSPCHLVRSNVSCLYGCDHSTL